MTHLLVTNDFPPKHGGIQSYLYELWRRLPPNEFAVLTTDHDGAKSFDATLSFRVERVRRKLLLPSRDMRARVDALAREIGADLVMVDPALPVGAIGPSLEAPYGLVLHGAEVTVPAHFYGARRLLARLIDNAHLIIAAGNYPARVARRLCGSELSSLVVVPPGVDIERFAPLSADERAEKRAALGLVPDDIVVLGLSRLVPRKGMDVLIEAAAHLAGKNDALKVLIAGKGRDGPRLSRLARRLGAPVRFLGSVEDVEKPALYGAADIFCMLCRDRWLGLEQEGFGIVFLEAAACGTAVLAGRSGGAPDAVDDGITGIVVDRPADTAVATSALSRLLNDAALRARLGASGRDRVVEELSYDVLAVRLRTALAEATSKYRSSRSGS